MCVLGAANRDPSVFVHPDKLDLRRSGPAHLAFGAGAIVAWEVLAATVAANALTRLVLTYPTLRLAGDTVQWRDEVRANRGPRELPAVIDPAG